MNLCSDGHDEVCYETRHCPVCEIKDDLNIQIEKLESQIGDIEVKLLDAQDELKKIEETRNA
jgi:hypothetical protein